jgi:hypothetical protein
VQLAGDVPSCWNTSGEATRPLRGHGGHVFHLHVRVAPGGQAVAASFCMIFCTFSSSVALVKGLTM